MCSAYINSVCTVHLTTGSCLVSIYFFVNPEHLLRLPRVLKEHLGHFLYLALFITKVLSYSNTALLAFLTLFVILFMEIKNSKKLNEVVAPSGHDSTFFLSIFHYITVNILPVLELCVLMVPSANQHHDDIIFLHLQIFIPAPKQSWFLFICKENSMQGLGLAI